MRVVIVSSLFPPFAIGGAEQVAANLARALTALGCEVDVISTCVRRSLEGAPFRVDHWQGIRVWRLAPRNLYWRYEKEQRQPGGLLRAIWHGIDLWNPSVFRPLEMILRQVQPDVVSTHNIDGFSPAVWQAARKYASAIVHTLHDYHLVCPRATMRRRDGTMCQRLCHTCGVYAHYHRLFAGNVQALIAPSQAMADVHRLAGWNGAAIHVVRNGVDVPAARWADVDDAEPLKLIFMSRMEREKGCETLLTVIPRCPGVEFHIAGDGTYAERFRQLGGNVTWHGLVSGQSKWDLLSNGDVFLQLSECRENAPLGLIEAQKCGLYIIGTEVGGIPELIGKTGALIPPAQPEWLLDALLTASDRKKTIRAGRFERARSAGDYDSRAMAREYQNVFRSTLG